MLMLVAGLVLFLGIHSLSIVSPSARERLIAISCPTKFRLFYSGVSIVGLVLIWIGYAEARMDLVQLYTPPKGMTHAALLLMLPAFPMLIATYVPTHIRAKLKHPMLTAVKTWALAHLLANGDLASVVLFGSFLAWAVIDRISLKRRNIKLPTSGPWRNDIIVVVLGVTLYVVMIMWLHRALIGVAPIASMG